MGAGLERGGHAGQGQGGKESHGAGRARVEEKSRCRRKRTTFHDIREGGERRRIKISFLGVTTEGIRLPGLWGEKGSIP